MQSPFKRVSNAPKQSHKILTLSCILESVDIYDPTNLAKLSAAR
jgi:hypothetical protein